MKKIEMKIQFKSNVQKVFKAVTNMHDYSWRSDLIKIEQINNNQYIEYNHKKIATTINVTEYLKDAQFEYDVKNDYYCGHWCGQFVRLKDGGCIMYLIFYFEVTSLLGKFVNVKKFEENYINDLKKKLGE